MINSILIPLVNFLIISLSGRYINRLGCMLLTSYAFIGLCFYNSCLLFSIITLQTTFYLNLGL